MLDFIASSEWYSPRHPHLAMLSDSTLNVGRYRSVDDFFIDSLTAYAGSRSVPS
jgi:hypothetical protein